VCLIMNVRGVLIVDRTSYLFEVEIDCVGLYFIKWKF
jgi:hypothetical protein